MMHPEQIRSTFYFFFLKKTILLSVSVKSLPVWKAYVSHGEKYCITQYESWKKMFTSTACVSVLIIKNCPPEAAQMVSSMTRRLLTGKTPNFTIFWGSEFQVPSLVKTERCSSTLKKKIHHLHTCTHTEWGNAPISVQWQNDRAPLVQCILSHFFLPHYGLCSNTFFPFCSASKTSLTIDSSRINENTNHEWM